MLSVVVPSVLASHRNEIYLWVKPYLFLTNLFSFERKGSVSRVLLGFYGQKLEREHSQKLITIIRTNFRKRGVP
jgi:hypothetical protein